MLPEITVNICLRDYFQKKKNLGKKVTLELTKVLGVRVRGGQQWDMCSF